MDKESMRVFEAYRIMGRVGASTGAPLKVVSSYAPHIIIEAGDVNFSTNGRDGLTYHDTVTDDTRSIPLDAIARIVPNDIDGVTIVLNSGEVIDLHMGLDYWAGRLLKEVKDDDMGYTVIKVGVYLQSAIDAANDTVCDERKALKHFDFSKAPYWVVKADDSCPIPITDRAALVGYLETINHIG